MINCLSTAFFDWFAIPPPPYEVDDWDNHRIQDADITYIPELGGYVMTCNLKAIDGNSCGNFPTLKGDQTRVIFVFYHENVKVHEAKKK